MSTQQRNYVVRLSAEGKQQLERDLKGLGMSGQKSLKMIQRAGKPASEGLRATDRAARDLQGGLRSVSNELPALQRLARFMGTTALAGAVVAFGRSSLDVGRQFEAAMKRVQAATQSSEAQLQLLSNAARETGQSTAFTAMQAADAIEVLAKNGLDVEAILAGALDATVRMAGALGAELAPAGDLVTDMMQQFRLEAAEMPGIADAVAGAALTSKFGFDDLRLAIGQAGGVAGAFGVEYREFLTILSATSASFASGSDAGTSFKNFLQRLTPQSSQAAAAMERLGLEFYQADGTMKSMVEVAGELEDGVRGLSESARNAALQEIFGTDAIRTALALANTGADGFRDLAAALGDVSAEEQAQVRLEGLDGALKELSAAWEAVQLSSAENGGLDAAEHTVERLTEALRYLSENFETVEEVAERVAQALIVVLVGKGITLAVARAVAMRAAYIELAGAVTGVGTAASRSIGPLTRLGIAGRALTGMMGGPLGLALTAASLVSLGIDIDRTADQIDTAEAASRRGAEALDAYRAAAERAAEKQQELGGEVDETTRKMAEQSRLQLQESLRDLEAARDEILGDLLGEGGGPFQVSEIRVTVSALERIQRLLSGEGGSRNRFVEGVIEALRDFYDGRAGIGAVHAAYQEVLGIGREAKELVEEFNAAIAEGGQNEAAERVIAYARSVGLFAEELDALGAAEPYSEAWFGAFRRLQQAMLTAEEASRVLRNQTSDGLVEMAGTAAETEGEIATIEEALRGVFETASEDPGETGLNRIEEDAKAAADRIRELGRVYGEYQRSRGVAAAPESADKVLRKMGGSADATSATSALLRHFEGFQPTGTWDVNAYRAGYGSDTVTLSDGTIRKVTEGMRVSVEDANRDLRRRIGEFQDVVRGQVGADRFEVFNPAQQGVLTSIAYNYGSLPDRILDAVRSGTDREIGEAIAGLRWDNGGINESRRLTEAAVFTRGVGVEQAAERQERDAARSAEERARARERDAEALTRLVAAGDERLAQLELEAQLAGKSAAEQARLTYLHEQLTQARQAGIDVETTQTASGERLIDVIRRQADALADRTRKQEAARKATEQDLEQVAEARDAVSSAFDNFRAGGDGLRGFFGDLFQFLADKLWDLAFDPVWDALAEGLSSLLGSFGGGTGSGAGAGSNADGGPIGAYASGGGLRYGGRAAGMLPGTGGKRQDNILFWGSRGEFMQPASAVDYYGTGFMEAVRQRRLPRPETGSMPYMPAGGAGAPVGAGGGSLAVRVFVDEGGALRAAIESVSGAVAADVVETGIARYDAGTQGRVVEAMRRAGNQRMTRERLVR